MAVASSTTADGHGNGDTIAGTTLGCGTCAAAACSVDAGTGTIGADGAVSAGTDAAYVAVTAGGVTANGHTPAFVVVVVVVVIVAAAATEIATATISYSTVI